MLSTIITLTCMSLVGSYIGIIRKFGNLMGFSDTGNELINLNINQCIGLAITMGVAPFLEECSFTIAIPMLLRDMGLYHDYLICLLFGLVHMGNLGVFVAVDATFQVINTILFRYVIIGHSFYTCVLLHYYFNIMGVSCMIFWAFVAKMGSNSGSTSDQDYDHDFIFIPERSRSVGDMKDYYKLNNSAPMTDNKQIVSPYRTMSEQLNEVESKRRDQFISLDPE